MIFWIRLRKTASARVIRMSEKGGDYNSVGTDSSHPVKDDEYHGDEVKVRYWSSGEAEC